MIINPVSESDMAGLTSMCQNPDNDKFLWEFHENPGLITCRHKSKA